MVKFLTAFFIMSLMIACEKVEEKSMGEATEWESGHITEITKGEMVGEKSFMASVTPRDTIHVAARGVRLIPHFSEYIRPSKSYWMDEKACYDGDIPRPSCPGGVKEFKRSGSCQLRYRKQEENLEEPILLKEDAAIYPLLLVIGNTPYPASRVRVKGSHWVLFELVVTEEMLGEGNDFYLDVIEEEEETIRVGFLDYRSCRGVGKEGFYFNGPTDFEMVSRRPLNTFEVFVTIEQK